MDAQTSQSKQALITYALHLADNNLILTQRNAEWCGHGPILEQDIAITNITLDLIGQARNFYQYAASLMNASRDDAGSKVAVTEDALAFLRTEREFRNCLLTEQPNGDWAQTILRQFLYSAYQFFLYEAMQHSTDTQFAGIAAKALKEVTYHLTWSGEWVIRLGDGTDESRRRLQYAVNELWRYTAEMFEAADYELNAETAGIAPALSVIRQKWQEKIKQVFEEATITMPQGDVFMQTGGKTGIHSEHLGYMLAEMQYLQRTYPGAEW